MQHGLSAFLVGYWFLVGAAAQQGWSHAQALQQFAQDPKHPFVQFALVRVATREGRRQEAVQMVEQVLNQGLSWRAMHEGSKALFDLVPLATDAALLPRAQLARLKGELEHHGEVPIAEIAPLALPERSWELPAGAKPGQACALAGCVPDDQWFVEFDSPVSLQRVLDEADRWVAHFWQQARADATGQDVALRLRRQLLLEVPELGQATVALTGSDLCPRAGCDVTVLLQTKAGGILRELTKAQLQQAAQRWPDGRGGAGEIDGVRVASFVTPDRAVAVFAADPQADLHVRSNSEPALRRVLAAIGGRGRLADSAEHKWFVHRLADAPRQGFVHVPGRFLQSLLGAQAQLTEARRRRCQVALRMIGHAALLHRLETGKAADSLAALQGSPCWEAVEPCPGGGRHTLAKDGLGALCSLHGDPRMPVPCGELGPAIATASVEEREAWLRARDSLREGCSPLAAAIRLDDKLLAVRALLAGDGPGNIAQDLRKAFDDQAQLLDGAPVSPRCIFSFAAGLNPQMLASQLGEFVEELMPRDSPEAREFGGSLQALVEHGVGAQLAIHFCDHDPMFDLSLPVLLGEVIDRPRIDDEMLWISFLVASLNCPVYVTIPVRDPQRVDAFLADVDRVCAAAARKPPGRGGFLDFTFDFALLPEGQVPVRSASIAYEPVRWRLFWARVGSTLCIASKRSLIEDLLRSKPPESRPIGHLMLRLRAENWRRIVPEFQLGWAERQRAACLNNQGPLSFAPDGLAERVFGLRLRCPDGGTYEVDPKTRAVRCSVHGARLEPRQGQAPHANSDYGRMLLELAEVTATLTLLRDAVGVEVAVRKR